MLSERKPPASVRTSGVFTRPEVISISPLCNAVTVGYQRPAAMFGPRLQLLRTGSKRCVWTIPFSCWSLFPPARNIRPSSEMRQPAAEDVEAGIDVDRRLGARHRIPHRRTREVLHRIPLGRVVPDRVVGEHLAVRQQRNVHTDDRPIDDRAPLADVLRGPGGEPPQPRPAAKRRHRARVGIERPLLRRRVHDRILRCMAGSRLDPLMRPRTRRRDRGHQQRCNSRHHPPEHEPPFLEHWTPSDYAAAPDMPTGHSCGFG